MLAYLVGKISLHGTFMSVFILLNHTNGLFSGIGRFLFLTFPPSLNNFKLLIFSIYNICLDVRKNAFFREKKCKIIIFFLPLPFFVQIITIVSNIFTTADNRRVRGFLHGSPGCSGKLRFSARRCI